MSLALAQEILLTVVAPDPQLMWSSAVKKLLCASCLQLIFYSIEIYSALLYWSYRSLNTTRGKHEGSFTVDDKTNDMWKQSGAILGGT